MSEGLVPSGTLKESVPLTLKASRGCLHSLALVLSLHLQSAAPTSAPIVIIPSLPSSLQVDSHGYIVPTQAIQDDPPISKSLA